MAEGIQDLEERGALKVRIIKFMMLQGADRGLETMKLPILKMTESKDIEAYSCHSCR